MCDSISVFRVQANVSARLRRRVSVPRTRKFHDTLLADVHFWNYQGREVLVYSLIDEFISLKSCHHNQLVTCVKRS